MSWNYRILRHEDGTFALHEVYYDEDGRPRGYTAEPLGFCADEEEGPEAIAASLELALRDARERPVLNAVEIGKVEGISAEATADALTTLTSKMSQLPPERRARIEAEAERLHAEYLTLKDLRTAKDLTHAQLAEALGVRPATLAQLERRSDLLISTLRSHVEAMGGRLRLTVEFPGKMPVSLEGLGDTEEPAPRHKARQPGCPCR